MVVVFSRPETTWGLPRLGSDLAHSSVLAKSQGAVIWFRVGGCLLAKFLRLFGSTSLLLVVACDNAALGRCTLVAMINLALLVDMESFKSVDPPDCTRTEYANPISLIGQP